MGVFRQDGEALDPVFDRFIRQTDGAKFYEDEVIRDQRHPTDRSRSLLGDLRKAHTMLEEKA